MLVTFAGTFSRSSAHAMPSPIVRRWTLLGTVVVLEGAWVLDQDAFRGSMWWLAVAVVLSLHAWLVHLERARPLLSHRVILAATCLVAVAAVCTSPYGSHDVYQYAMYGRMVTFHHVNPYVTAPAAFPGDPLYGHLSPIWHRTSTVYGPLFTAVSAAGATLYGGSATAARLYFQVLEAVALVGAVLYMARRRMGSAALVFVGLSPVLVATVNGAHNDLLAGVVVLIGIDLARRDRLGWSAVALSAATLIKLLAAPALFVVVLALLVNRRWRAAAKFGASSGALLVGGYALAGGPAALGPVLHVDKVASRASLWTSLHGLGLPPHGISAALPSPTMLSLLLCAGICVVLAVHGLRTGIDLSAATVAIGAVAIFGALYVLPWYPAAILPVAALAMGSAARRAVQVGSAALMVAYVAPPGAIAPEGLAAHPVGHLCGAVLGAVIVSLALAHMPRPAWVEHLRRPIRSG